MIKKSIFSNLLNKDELPFGLQVLGETKATVCDCLLWLTPIICFSHFSGSSVSYFIPQSLSFAFSFIPVVLLFVLRQSNSSKDHKPLQKKWNTKQSQVLMRDLKCVARPNPFSSVSKIFVPTIYAFILISWICWIIKYINQLLIS